MSRNVKVNIIGNQKLVDNPGHPEVLNEDELYYQGEGILYCKHSIYYLVYLDSAGVRTTIKMDKDKQRVVVLREEPWKLTQTFLMGEKTAGSYGIGSEELKLEVKTQELDLELKTDRGEVWIKYSLFLGGQYISENSLRINWTTYLK